MEEVDIKTKMLDRLNKAMNTLEQQLKQIRDDHETLKKKHDDTLKINEILSDKVFQQTQQIQDFEEKIEDKSKEYD